MKSSAWDDMKPGEEKEYSDTEVVLSYMDGRIEWLRPIHRTLRISEGGQRSLSSRHQYMDEVHIYRDSGETVILSLKEMRWLCEFYQLALKIDERVGSEW